ncbi:MAG: phosphoribosylformylglycinamidine cyclo-ligase [Candidatus Margulisbacteria bacterium]|nr:phosphoribosylformylglycinamidine cyclo-ligase [Candidatus Margulisiibacteriota bacterium]MBU1021346.1 phosphoribosylformylglycinamidine cyclo-ligase [Candidatus Margulisiibacteriota bacterium]MBU1729165.1 phosphoribosylformylglycinamidine cyclo-ligase [Candidatus Margulisiibacteriota bacterium]MBU1954838.1 phosphoribosylformylglycinamidine cyclo-ligase [Candidatus Margulisiibacteriota bacterium]
MSGLTYKKSGVDIEAGYGVVRQAKALAKTTFDRNVLSSIGGFGAAYSLSGYKNPLLISGADGVGTKLKIAIMMDKHDTVGIDLVAMNVDDVVTCGAKPLFFLDYIATGKIKPRTTAQILKGITKGCKLAGCALIGGETAEMPDFYAKGEYDLAGFAVGAVEKKNYINGSRIKKGDVIIGIASSGFHSNGYSLVRKVFFDVGKMKVTTRLPELKSTLGEALLTPTKIYAKSLLNLLKKVNVKGMAHITGGGFPENVARILPNKKLGACIGKDSWPALPIFEVLQDIGEISDAEMYKTFNMGIGMVVVVAKKDVSSTIRILKNNKEKAYVIGEIIDGQKGVCLC